MQTKNINIKFPQAKAGAEDRLRFIPQCRSLIVILLFLEVMLRFVGLNILPIVVHSGVSE